GYESGRLELPLGYIQGQKLDLELVRLTQHVHTISHFDELAIPFRAVATDIETGDEIVLGSGNLARAIRASMAVPGAFDAVEMDGRLLVDGLVTNNVPLDVARKMGADIAIVVNVGTPLKERGEITSALAIIEQYSNIVGQQNVSRQLDTLRETDVYIHPELGDISTSDFNRAAETIGLGADAARTEGAKLAKLAITPSGYSGHLAARGGRVGAAPIVGFVRIENQSKIGDDVLAHPFQALIGKPLDQRTLKRSIEELYGWNIFESIRYEIIEEEDKQGLLVHVRDKSWGPNYLQLGLALSTDLEGDSTWDIGVSLLKTALNRRAGELRLAAQIGESPLVLAEFYQPLDLGLRYFITPQLFFDSRSFSRFEDGDEIKEFRVKRYGGGLAAGRVLGRWGEIRAGLRRYAGDGEVRIGGPATSDFDFDSAEAYLRLYYDTLDNRNWPRSGAIGSLEWIESVEGLGADSDFSQLLFMGALAHSWDKNTFVGGFEFDYTADGVAPVQNRFRTGGFTELSGFTQDQLSGQQVLLLRSGYYRRLGNVKWLPAYAGVSLEYGNVYEDRDDISLAPDEALLAGSVFLGMDTVLGPVYLAYGHAEQGNDSIYLYLGRLF
ncbi:MAG: patatin-like phospholipase family protein, partial [Gammaproteobacteria bacterium]